MPLLAPLALLAFLAPKPSDEVGPGLPAPKLAVKRWIKGAPIPEIAPRGLYVVEFWATWCGPCVGSIPHLTEIAKKNPDVTFVGISIWEDGAAVKPFVDKMGAKMDYHVAYGGDKDGMATSWMKAAGQNGIPTAFVVEDGVVVWIGHPMELEAPLREIKAGTFDLEAFKEEFAKANAASFQEAAAFKAIDAAEALYATDRAAAKAALAKAARDNPPMAASIAAIRFGWLAKEDPKVWETQARALARSGKSRDMERLVGFAMKQTESPANFPLARRAVALALQAEPRGFDALNAASIVYRETGDYDKALDATRKMLLYFPTGQVGGEPGFKAELLKRKAELVAFTKGSRA